MPSATARAGFRWGRNPYPRPDRGRPGYVDGHEGWPAAATSSPGPAGPTSPSSASMPRALRWESRTRANAYIADSQTNPVVTARGRGRLRGGLAVKRAGRIGLRHLRPALQRERRGARRRGARQHDGREHPGQPGGRGADRGRLRDRLAIVRPGRQRRRRLRPALRSERQRTGQRVPDQHHDRQRAVAARDHRAGRRRLR